VISALVLLLVAASPPAEGEAEALNRLMEPGDVDVRAIGGTNILLLNVNFGLLAEVGLLRLGPGTLAIGAEFDAGYCATVCGLIDFLTGLEHGQQYYFQLGRLAYHFPLQPNPTLKNIDLYAVVLAGAAYSRMGAKDASGTQVYSGEGFSPSVGIGAGIVYFLGAHPYLGFELRARYAQGDYQITFKEESYTFQDPLETRWYASGLNWMLFLGVRI
jgi:hypothetical protein